MNFSNLKNTARPLFCLFAICFLLVACGESDDPDDTGDALHEGEHGLVLEAHLDPDPPQSGAAEMTLILTVDGEPLEGAQVSVEPWMPGHGHGSNTDAVVVDEGEGIYRVDDLSFSMAGLWEIRVDVAWDDLETQVVWEVDVDG